MGESAEKIVNTNMGAMPLEDYLDIVALQHGSIQIICNEKII